MTPACAKQSLRHHSADTLYLGIDGGGSKCQAKVFCEKGNIIGMGKSGRANPLHGFDTAINSIVESTYLAIEDAGLDKEVIGQLIAGVGLAGVNLPSVYQQVNAWQHPFRQLFLTTDLHIACYGAHQSNTGSVLIVGTGSCGISLQNGQSTILGAHGFHLGDQGSGAWIGSQAIKAVLLAQDGLAPATILTDYIHSELQTGDMTIVEIMTNAAPTRFANLAPIVFRAAHEGDEVANTIIKNGTAYLNQLANKILNINPARLSILGGLRDVIKPWLDQRVLENLCEPIGQPEDGALYFAQKELNHTKLES